MTELLQQAIAEIEKLPAGEQDAIAKRLLAELADEREWASHFNATSNDEWDRLTQTVREEIAAGDIAPLDDVFPRDSSRP